MDSSPKDQNAGKDAYLEKLYEIYTYSNTEFDKNILYIASGALGLTVTFIDKIVPLRAPATHYQTILFLGWLSLTASIVLYLFSHQYSKAGTSKVIIKYKEYKDNKCTQNDVYIVRDRCNRNIRRYNNFSSVCLVLGIILVLVFIYSNI